MTEKEKWELVQDEGWIPFFEDWLSRDFEYKQLDELVEELKR